MLSEQQPGSLNMRRGAHLPLSVTASGNHRRRERREELPTSSAATGCAECARLAAELKAYAAQVPANGKDMAPGTTDLLSLAELYEAGVRLRAQITAHFEDLKRR